MDTEYAVGDDTNEPAEGVPKHFVYGNWDMQRSTKASHEWINTVLLKRGRTERNRDQSWMCLQWFTKALSSHLSLFEFSLTTFTLLTAKLDEYELLEVLENAKKT